MITYSPALLAVLAMLQAAPADTNPVPPMQPSYTQTKRLRDGTVVELARGARLTEPLGRITSPVHVVDLEGRALFKARTHLVLAERQIVSTSLVIRTRGAMILARKGDVEVDARGDTTDVQLLERTQRLRDKGISANPDFLIVTPRDSINEKTTAKLNEGDRARGVRGSVPLRFAP